MSQALAETSVIPPSAADESYTGVAIERIRDALRGLRFGTVSVIVQDGVVVQVERTEKLRLVKKERER